MSDLTITDAELSERGLELKLAVGARMPDSLQALTPQSVVAFIVWDTEPAGSQKSALRRADFKISRKGDVLAVVPLPTFGKGFVLKGILISPGPDSAAVSLDTAVQRRLESIFPCSDGEYIASFQSHKTRWGNARTRFYIYSQIVRSFRGASEHRIGAALVAAYKAVEIGNDALVREAFDLLNIADELLPKTVIGSHPRSNREHLEVSLLSARWHLQAALGDVQAVMDTMVQLSSVCQRRSSYWTLAYSGSKSLLLSGWLLWRCDRIQDATKHWEQCVQLFKRAVEEADARKPVLFRELKHSFEAAHLAGICLVAANNSRVREMPTLELVLPAATRVQRVPQERMQKALETALAPLRGSGGVPV